MTTNYIFFKQYDLSELYVHEHNANLYYYKEYYDINTVKRESWYKGNLVYHREDGPAIINYYQNGNKETEKWLINGEHIKESPYLLEYYETGILKTKCIKFDNDIEYISDYYPSGNIKKDRWYKDMSFHRETGPAIIEYYESGNISNMKWYLNSKDITSVLKLIAKTNLIDAYYYFNKDEFPEEYHKSLKQASLEIFE